MSMHRQIFFDHLGLPSMKPMGLDIVKAEGIYFYDRNGKRYIDLVSGVAVSNLGHRHPEVVTAIKEQADSYLHLMVYGEFIQSPQVLLAETLISHLPEKLDHVYFVNSGSEAIDGAIKLARRFTGRTEVIAFKNAYHGGTFGALSILGEERLKNAFRPLVPDVMSIRFNDPDALAQITNRTACVVAETVQAEAGIIPAAHGFMQALRKRCSETGTLLVIDDIQMGMGRTGKLFSFEHDNITPDILVLAKAFGGGMPLGAFISSRAIMRSLTFNPELGHITTFGGHPVSCAAALASLKVILREKPFLNADTSAERFIGNLQHHPKIKEIRHKGLMMAIELAHAEECRKMTHLLMENGIVVDAFLFRPQAFRIGPPLIISNEEIDTASEIILHCLDQL
jgi:acetylornithine/succinyldiaminopimelate/putrescine aminotransferase